MHYTGCSSGSGMQSHQRPKSERWFELCIQSHLPLLARCGNLALNGRKKIRELGVCPHELRNTARFVPRRPLALERVAAVALLEQFRERFEGACHLRFGAQQARAVLDI